MHSLHHAKIHQMTQLRINIISIFRICVILFLIFTKSNSQMKMMLNMITHTYLIFCRKLVRKNFV